MSDDESRRFLLAKIDDQPDRAIMTSESGLPGLRLGAGTIPPDSAGRLQL